MAYHRNSTKNLEMRKTLYALLFMLLIGNMSSCNLEESLDCIAEFILVDIDYNASSTNVKEITLTVNYSGSYSMSNIEWDFGDGSTGSGNPATHTYAAPGNYDVSATVTLDNGDVDCTTDVGENITVL